MIKINILIATLINMATRLFKSILTWSPQSSVSRFLSVINQPDLLAIRKDLQKFEGGSVDLHTDEETGIAVMTLNNPEKRNSLTGKMMVDMADRVSQLEKWANGRGLIVLGTGGHFCSGGDLTFVQKALHYGGEMAAFQHDTLTRLHNLPLVSVALLQGHTLGGGAELSTACDFRVMSSTARIGFVQIKMGVTAGWGATTRLVHLLGRHKALGLLSSAKVFSAEEALGEGLVDHILPYSLAQSEELDECKKWLSSNYCAYDADLIQGVKSSVVYSELNPDINTSLKFEREVFTKFWGGPLQKAALAAKIKHK
ncbi:unnamed protein product [Lymnaea stagnalis]|uniref:Ethylmalonyl-CoA decarboxylase n=1 Tax=Lymnaea stagnalis TaxID=6523 RepID=A0AAV2IR63_LYMST